MKGPVSCATPPGANDSYRQPKHFRSKSRLLLSSHELKLFTTLSHGALASSLPGRFGILQPQRLLWLKP